MAAMDIDARQAVLRQIAGRIAMFTEAERALRKAGLVEIAEHVHVRYVSVVDRAYAVEARDEKPKNLP